MTRSLFLALALLSGIWSTAVVGQSVPTITPVPASASASALGPASGPAPATIPAVQETLSARTLVRLEQMTRELSQTIGRVEALEGAVAAQKAENDRLVALIDANRAAQVGARAPEETASKAISSEQAAAIMATTSDAETTLFVTATPPPLSPAIMLTNAQSALQSGSFPVAEANLSQLVWVHPTSPEASEGRWLLGEARYVQGAWGTAAQAYVDYLKATPQGPRGPEALVRLAGTFRQLGDNRQRCIALAEFKRRAPRPDATLKARADGEIARMTCPAV